MERYHSKVFLKEKTDEATDSVNARHLDDLGGSCKVIRRRHGNFTAIWCSVYLRIDSCSAPFEHFLLLASQSNSS